MHRFILLSSLSVGEMVIEDGEVARQIKDVLRLRVGEKIILGDGAGNEAEAAILELGKKNFSVKISQIDSNQREPKQPVILYCAILKRENFEWVVQKAVEVGVKEIVPIITDRTVKAAINVARLQKISKEAAEQSGRGIVPTVSKPMGWQQAIENSKDQRNLFCHFGGKSVGVVKAKGDVLGVWVGPEGGWSEKEVSVAKDNGFEIVSLGNTVLRGETAVVVGSFLAVNL